MSNAEILEEWNKLHTLRPLDDWHEDDGPVLWHNLPISEPPYCGTPLDCDFNDELYTHWSPMPNANVMQDRFDTANPEGAK